MKEEELATLREYLAKHTYEGNYSIARQYLYLIEEIEEGDENKGMEVPSME